MIYVEQRSRFWQMAGLVGTIAGVICFALDLTGVVKDASIVGLTLLLTAPLFGMCFWGIRRYSTIKLDATDLRVGRDSVAVRDIVAVFEASELPPRYVDRPPGGRLFGGSWGLGAFLSPVGFKTNTNPYVQIIGTENPEVLIEHLRALINPAERAT